ncbi:MAG: hypothetical protein AAFN79_01725 [Pseudomonadota bacterium]
MITSSPMLAAMGLGVKAVERRSDFEQNAMNLRRARDEAKRAWARRDEAQRDTDQDPSKS